MVLEMINKQLNTPEGWITGRETYGDFLYEKGLLETFAKEGGGTNTSLHPDTEYMDGHFTTYAMDKLTEYKEERPFFMWMNYSGPHGPFNVPEGYVNGLFNSNMPLPIDPQMETFEVPAELKKYPNDIYNAYTTLGYRKNYVGAITYVDDQIGRLLSYIKTSRYKDNTVIIFFSDHGIMTGDHGLLGKNTLFKEVLNASLIISYPKFFEPKLEETPVELIDLVKTTLELAQVSDGTLNSVRNGNSLLPLLNCEGTFTGAGLAFSEMRDFKSVFDGEFKYIHHKETPILFNLEQNPDETENWIERNPEKAAELKQAVELWLNR
jgi:iduronate 2-sulfatase